jgi:hypothetical protein
MTRVAPPVGQLGELESRDQCLSADSEVSATPL